MKSTKDKIPQTKQTSSSSLHNINYSLKRLLSEGNTLASPTTVFQEDSGIKYPTQYFQKNVIPKNINVEKEQLYEQVLLYKQNVNKLTKENKSLKTSISGYENQFSRQINLSNQQIDYPDACHSAQLSTYKREIKYKNDDLKQKDQQILNLRKSMQNHRLQFLQDELEKKIIEIDELKLILKQNINTKMNLVDSSQVNVVEVLSQDNMEMAAMVKKQLTKINLIQAQCKDYETRHYQLNVKNQGVNRVLIEKQKEVDRLRQRDPIQDMNIQNNAQNEIKLKSDNESKSQQISQLQIALNQSQKRVSELERQKQLVVLDLTEKYSQIDKEKQFFKEMCDKNQRENKELNEKLKYLEKIIASTKTRKSIQFVVQFPQEDSPWTQKNLVNIPEDLDNSFDELTVQRVQKSQVKQLALLLKFKLRTQKIQSSELDSYLFQVENNSTGVVSINELEEVFHRHPFQIEDAHKRRLFVRYLIEDNPKSQFIFDENLTANIAQVRSVFKTLLSNYQLFNTKDVMALLDEINLLFRQYKGIITDCLLLKPLISDHYQFDDLLAIIQQKEIPLKSKHIDFMTQVLYDRTQNIEVFKLEEFFNYFDQDNDYNFV